MGKSNIEVPPGSIFICYRREDSADVTGRIYDRLADHFGPEHVFIDVEAIRLGYDFRTEIDERIKACSIVIVVIGDEWLTQVDGKRRIDDENDRVRIEIEAAFRREIPIIPVLTRGASHPTKAMLPASLEALAYRHGTSIRHEHFRGDVDFLVAEMDKLLAHQESPPAKPIEPEKPLVTEGDAVSVRAPVAGRDATSHFAIEAGPSKLEKVPKAKSQKTREANVNGDPDCSSLSQPRIESRVANRESGAREGISPALHRQGFDRDLIIFAAKWMAACLVGEAVGRGIGLRACRAMQLSGNFNIFQLVYCGFIGAAVGIAQWLLLRGRIAYSKWWIPVTVMGCAVGGLATPSYFANVYPANAKWLIAALTIDAMFIGIAIGIAQWLVLRRSVSRSAWWIPIVGFGGELSGAGVAVVMVLQLFGDWSFSWWDFPAGAIRGAISGLITGFSLAILLRRAEKEIRS